ncbi:MAG: TIGR04255 family protein [Tatlockia sp.]
MNYKKLSNQPLKFVIAEFKFSPVLQINKFIPNVQEAFRKKYPLLDKSTEHLAQISSNGFKIENIDRWSFISSDKKHAVELNQGRMIYFTSVYDRFDGFLSSCEEALKIISEIIKPSLIERIGLRYSDLVLLNSDEKMKSLINTHFTYPTEISDLGTIQQQKTEVLIKTEQGQLAIRTLYGCHGLSYLPDLHNRLPISVQMENKPSERIILDFDHFWETGDDSLSFDIKNVIQTLSSLHIISRKAFWQITTDYARNNKWA